MNVIFLTQSNTLSLFYNLLKTFREKTEVDKVGFYIADSKFYNTFQKQHPEISSNSLDLLKEWEIIGRSKKTMPDIERLRRYEKRLGDPVLWNALIADRRIYLGKRAMMEQDYNSRFNHENMLALLQTGLDEIEGIFDRVQPDVVVGFICVTIGEYLAYLVAKSRNIQFLNLRPTRIRNYFFAGESVLEPSRQLEEIYRRMLSEGIPEHLQQEVSSYLSEARRTNAMYEGVVPATNPHGMGWKGIIKGMVSAAVNLGGLLKEYYEYNFGKYRHDNHYRGVFYKIWLKNIKRPARIRYADFFLRRHYISADKLRLIDYAFYPLHKEPEVTLLVYGRPYLNQIEVVCNYARSLPVGMKLVVKEHPAAIGYRPLSYYKKLLAIPNVVLAPPEITSRELIQNVRMVTIIGGSIGFEALIMKKPVIIIGHAPFSFLPDTMIRYIQNMDNLSWEIKDLLKNHNHDEAALMAYLAAVIDSSVSVDFYSILLGKKGVYRPSGGIEKIDDQYQKQIERLSEYILNRIKC